MSSNTHQKNAKPQPDVIELGKIVGVWGVKGWLKVFSYTRNRQDIGDYKEWLLSSARQVSIRSSDCRQVQVKQCRLQGQNVVAQLEGIADRNQAQALIGQTILIHSSQLPALPKGEYYWRQLIGLSVINLKGESLGTVSTMLETGANDVFVVVEQLEQTRQERLIPHIDDVVVEVNLEDKLLTVDWDKDF